MYYLGRKDLEVCIVKLRKVQLDILDVVASFCERHE